MLELGNDKTKRVLDDYRTAPIDDRLRATLAFLEKMTLTPEALSAADAEQARAARVDDQMLNDAIHVCAAFSLIERIADGVGFHVPDAAAFAAMTKPDEARLYLKRYSNERL